jgi:HEAT repeat protein
MRIVRSTRGRPAASAGRAPFTVLLLLCLALFTGLAPAQSREERLDAVQEFKRFFRQFQQVDQKVEAIKTLERAECPEAAKELVELLGHREERIAREAADILATYRSPDTFAPFVAELAEMSDAEEQARLIRALGRAEQRSAVPRMREILDGNRVDDEVRVAIAVALQTVGSQEEADLVGKLLEDGDARVRLAAADAAAALKLRSLGDQLVAMLDDKEWQVQLAVVTACGKARVTQAIEPLITLMENESGRVDEECAEALFQIMGQDFGLDEKGWRRSWETLSKIEGWRPPTDEELAKRAASRKKYDALYGQVETTSFGGIKTVSTEIVFVIDISGSMEDVVVETEKFQGYEDTSKLGIVKTELINTIESLDANTRFNILAFARDRKPWKKFLVQANVVNKASAKRWVERLDVIGGSKEATLAGAGIGDLAAGKTNTYTALMFPFGIDPEKDRGGPSTRAGIENEIETVFFLSDGRPTAGKFVDEQEILDEVLRLNAEYRIVFHTIAIGEVQRDFMEQLARDTGGVFVDLGR